MRLLPFEAVEEEVICHYGRGDFEGALSVLDRSAPDLGSHWERVAYWRACLLARLGRSAAALDTLAQAVEAGAWWSPRLLETEIDLDPLWDEDGYRALLTTMHRRGQEWAPPVSGLYLGGTPGGWPFLGLHGRNQIFEVDAARMIGSLGEGWEIVLPESRQRVASDGPVWDDLEMCRRQVTELADRQWGNRPYVLGGFSQGARRALQMGLADGQRIAGVLAVSPMLLRSREMAEVMEAMGPPPWPSVVLVVGSADPAAEGVTAVARHLADEGVETVVEMTEGAGHQWLQPSSAALSSLARKVGHHP